jgi:hypothetical protein
MTSPAEQTHKTDLVYKPSATHRYWLYSPEGDGFMFFRTAAERDEFAATEIENYCDHDSGWYEEVKGITAGYITHHIVETITATRPDNYYELDEDDRDEVWPLSDGFDAIAEYKLKRLPRAPLSDKKPAPDTPRTTTCSNC